MIPISSVLAFLFTHVSAVLGDAVLVSVAHPDVELALEIVDEFEGSGALAVEGERIDVTPGDLNDVVDAGIRGGVPSGSLSRISTPDQVLALDFDGVGGPGDACESVAVVEVGGRDKRSHIGVGDLLGDSRELCVIFW